MIHANQLSLPLELPASCIALPTGGATVTACTLFRAGAQDTSPFARVFGGEFPVDTWRYEGVIHPVDPEAPDIRFEAGFPAEWNGKAIQMGGGGVDGYVPPCSMHLFGQLRGEGSAQAQHYILFGADGGHMMNYMDPSDCSWIANRECFENFAHQSLKKARDVIVELARRVYGTVPSRIYFYGGSNGGRECMKAIQVYPADYDGAVCFFPVLYWVLKVLLDSRNEAVAHRLGEECLFTPEEYARIHETVLSVCGSSDGLIENISDATQAKESVKEALRTFLRPAQMELLEAMDAPFSLPYPLAFGDVTLPGYPVFEGSSAQVQADGMAQTLRSGGVSLGDNLVSWVLNGNPASTASSFDAERNRQRILDVSHWLDAYGTDLDAFRARGGKLILVQGTEDPLVTMHGTNAFYERLAARYGADIDRFAKYYLAPGYGHGTDGHFQITADFINVLDRWVEQDIAPAEITVTDVCPLTAGRTRPLLEYKQFSR